MAVSTATFNRRKTWQLEVSRELIDKVETRWKELIAGAPDRPLEALLDHYVSLVHRRRSRARSCVFVALIEEVSRSSGAVREIFNDGLSVLVDILAEIVPGETAEERRKNGFTTLSSMMGAVILARAVENRELAEQFLLTMREKLAPAKSADA